MSRITYRPGRLTAVAVAALVWLVAACGLSPTSSVATATQTPFVLRPTATPPVVTRQVPIPPTAQLTPSPDGTLLAAVYGNALTHATIRLYNLSAALQGEQYVLPAGVDATVGWLGDSSALWIFQSGGTFAALPLLLMDRQGHVHSIGFIMTTPQLSPDGRWIGGTALTSSGLAIGAEIAPRNGGPVRMLALGGGFIGWQDGRAIYVTSSPSSRLYALNPDGGAPLLLSQVAANVRIGAYGDSSPDDQVLILPILGAEDRLLVGNQLRPFLLNPGLAFWAGPHDFLTGGNPGEPDLEIEDIITGEVVSDTGASVLEMMPLAISGNWMIANSSSSPGPTLELNLINIVTQASYDLGPKQVRTFVQPLGDQGRFVVNPSVGDVYIIESTLVP